MPRLILALLLLAVSSHPHAAVLVLISGYLGEGDGWRETGVTRQLAGAGWLDGGHLLYTQKGVMIRGGRPPAQRTLYTLDLPSEAPLQMQARYLNAYLSSLAKRQPGQDLILVGHSAGGVVARLTLVQFPGHKVSALITLSSPHLGTGSAEVGGLVGRSPLGMLAPLVGGNTLNRSQALYRDLARERPNSLLYWLNRQPHPDIRYISVVRKDNSLLGLGDLVVPEWSQDMNRVQALRGKAETVRIETDGHALGAADGRFLARLLAR